MFKFVMGRLGDNELIVLALNDNLISHDELAQIYLREFNVVYAGFASFGNNGAMKVYGKSVILDIGSEGLDQDYFKGFVDFSICMKDVVNIPCRHGKARENFILAMGFKGSKVPEGWERVAEHKDVCLYLNKFYADNIH